MPEMRTLGGRERAYALNLTFEQPEFRQADAMRRRRRGQSGPVPVMIRNGVPWKPYVYQGVGWDIYTGEDDDDA